MKYRIAAVWLLGVVGCLAAAAHGEPAVRIDAIEVGFSNFYRPGHMIPVFVKLTNTLAAPFEGELRAVQTDDDGDRLHWRIPAPLAAKTTQWRHVLICPTPDALADGTVSISIGSVAGGDYRPVASVGLGQTDAASMAAMPRLPEALVDGEWTIGVIGNALGEFGQLNPPVVFNTVEPVRVVLMPTNRIPSMWQGLDMLDVVYWDDPRPDDLDDDQRQALVQWVWRGGHLIVGLGPHAPELGSRHPALAELIPVTVKQTGVRVPNLGPLHLALGGLPRAGPGTIVRVVPRSGAYVLARETSQSLPLMCRWAKGSGSVTVLSTTLGEAQLKKRYPSYSAGLLARLAGLHDGPLSPPAFGRRTSSVTDGLSSHLDSFKISGALVATVILMCLAYALVAGPGTWLYLRAKNQRHLSWWVFGAVVMVATLASVTLSQFSGDEEIYSAMVLDLSSGSPYGVVQGYFGLYIPAHRSPTVDVGTDPFAALLPMINPRGTTFGGFPDEKSYELDLTQPTQLTVPVRRTIKRFALSWRGDTGHHVAGSVMVSPPAEKGAKVAGFTAEITNELPVPLTRLVLIYATGGPKPIVTVATLGDDIPSGKTLLFTSDDPPAGSIRRKTIQRSLAKFHSDLVGHLGLEGLGAVGSPDFLFQVQMLSTMSRYAQPSGTDVNPTLNRLCLTRLDRLDQIHAGQALLIGQAKNYMPAPIGIDGRQVEAQGPTIVRVLIPVRNPASSVAAGAPAKAPEQ